MEKFLFFWDYFRLRVNENGAQDISSCFKSSTINLGFFIAFLPCSIWSKRMCFHPRMNDKDIQLPWFQKSQKYRTYTSTFFQNVSSEAIEVRIHMFHAWIKSNKDVPKINWLKRWAGSWSTNLVFGPKNRNNLWQLLNILLIKNGTVILAYFFYLQIMYLYK